MPGTKRVCLCLFVNFWIVANGKQTKCLNDLKPNIDDEGESVGRFQLEKGSKNAGKKQEKGTAKSGK